MIIKFFKNHYDIADEEGYYLLYLDDNPFMDTVNISLSKNVVPNLGFHMSKVKTRRITCDNLLNYLGEPLLEYEGDKSYILFEKYIRREDIPIIGVYKNDTMSDLITGNKVEYNSPTGLSYSKCIKIPTKIVKEVLSSLCVQDANSYARALYQIKLSREQKSKTI